MRREQDAVHGLLTVTQIPKIKQPRKNPGEGNKR